MSLYNPLPDDGFSSAQDSVSLFVAGFWQMEETGFHPKYDLASRQPEYETEDSREKTAENKSVEQEKELFAEALRRKTADAYAHGYLNGQQAIAVQLDESQGRQNALADAISRLEPADEAKLVRQLWEAVLSLFRHAVGDAEIDKELLQQRCETALKSIATEMGEACLYVAPDDARILQDYDCGVPVASDPKLLPGSVRVAYPSGQVTSGSLSIEQEIGARTGAVAAELDPEFGGASC